MNNGQRESFCERQRQGEWRAVVVPFIYQISNIMKVDLLHSSCKKKQSTKRLLELEQNERQKKKLMRNW